MKTCVLFAALAAASLAAVPAVAHDRTHACGHLPQRSSVHRAASYHPVHRAPVRHLAARSVHHNLQYASSCGCGQATRARLAYGERFDRPHYREAADYYEPRPIFYRPRIFAYREDFPIRRFRTHEFEGRGRGGYYGRRDHDRDFDHGRGRGFERRVAMNDGWGR